MVIHSFPYGWPALNFHAPCGAAGNAGLLLIAPGGGEQPRLVEPAADQLHADGSPAASKPQGTDSAGRPAMLTGTVQMSVR